MIVACETEGCENEGIEIEIPDTWTDTEGQEQPVAVVLCGVCEHWIIPPPVAKRGTATTTRQEP
ncbi:hypothetical protein [Microbacterium sp. NPDC089696]|uniref:hypothetical protein n=1 Tax=Microbacterium sp. NPDC089696 TaxID=3364199 RepID=UPI003814DE79